jgi:hypothetical protein
VLSSRAKEGETWQKEEDGKRVVLIIRSNPQIKFHGKRPQKMTRSYPVYPPAFI